MSSFGAFAVSRLRSVADIRVFIAERASLTLVCRWERPLSASALNDEIERRLFGAIENSSLQWQKPYL